MTCLNSIYHKISALHDIACNKSEYSSKFISEIVNVHVIKVTECCEPDDFQLSGKLLSKKFKNATVVQKLDPNEITGIYWIIYPDEDTLLMMIDELDGTIHLISNDFIYLQKTLTEFVFKNRHHFNTYRGEFDLEYDFTNEEKYFAPFTRELNEYFGLDHKMGHVCDDQIEDSLHHL